MEEEKVRKNIAKNICEYRKRCNLTQSQLAEKINYSDKAVSKWEREEGVPDTLVLLQMCEIFDVSLNDMISDKIKKQPPTFLRNRIIITVLSCLLVYLVATIAFVLLNFIFPNTEYTWLSFIFALPIVFILLVVFSGVWGTKLLSLLSISGLIWTTCLSIFFILLILNVTDNVWLIFIVGIPLQVLFLVFSLLKKKQPTV